MAAPRISAAELALGNGLSVVAVRAFLREHENDAWLKGAREVPGRGKWSLSTEQADRVARALRAEAVSPADSTTVRTDMTKARYAVAVGVFFITWILTAVAGLYMESQRPSWLSMVGFAVGITLVGAVGNEVQKLWNGRMQPIHTAIGVVLLILFIAWGGAVVARFVLPGPMGLVVWALICAVVATVLLLLLVFEVSILDSQRLIRAAGLAAVITGLVVFADDVRYRGFPDSPSRDDVAVMRPDTTADAGAASVTLHLGYSSITGRLSATVRGKAGGAGWIALILPSGSRLLAPDGLASEMPIAVPSAHGERASRTEVIARPDAASVINVFFRWGPSSRDPYERIGITDRTFYVSCIGSDDRFERVLPTRLGGRPVSSVPFDLTTTVGNQDEYTAVEPTPRGVAFGADSWHLRQPCGAERIGVRIVNHTASRLVSFAGDGFFVFVGFLLVVLFERGKRNSPAQK